MTLDFANEHLRFDLQEDVQLIDDGSALVIEAAIDLNELLAGLMINGELEVWQAAPERLMGRCPPYIPNNLDPARTMNYLQARREGLANELAHRRSRRESPKS
jgi:hypothetical protein